MITLTKELETGVTKIDEQHRELINRINAVTSMGAKSASKEETQKTIDLLGAYIVRHFSDEEELQKQCGFPNYESHKKLHKQFIDEFQNLKKDFIANGPSPKFTLTMNNSIIAWIVRHIKTSDVEFGKYFKEHKK